MFELVNYRWQEKWVTFEGKETQAEKIHPELKRFLSQYIQATEAYIYICVCIWDIHVLGSKDLEETRIK